MQNPAPTTILCNVGPQTPTSSNVPQLSPALCEFHKEQSSPSGRGSQSAAAGISPVSACYSSTDSGQNEEKHDLSMTHWLTWSWFLKEGANATVRTQTQAKYMPRIYMRCPALLWLISTHIILPSTFSGSLGTSPPPGPRDGLGAAAPRGAGSSWGEPGAAPRPAGPHGLSPAPRPGALPWAAPPLWGAPAASHQVPSFGV